MPKYRVIENINERKILTEVDASNLDEAYQKIKVEFNINLNKLYSSMYEFECISE